MSMTEGGADTIRSEFITGLRNAHALEKQARQLIERQLERVESYPDVAQKLRQHLDETNAQEERLDQLLARFDESRSVLKDMATQLMGNMNALMHAAADDEILKNTFANHAFENFEVASYRSLITMAEVVGETRFVTALQQNLREDENAAQMIKDMVEPITRKYMARIAAGEKADR